MQLHDHLESLDLESRMNLLKQINHDESEIKQAQNKQIDKRNHTNANKYLMPPI